MLEHSGVSFYTIIWSADILYCALVQNQTPKEYAEINNNVGLD